MQRLMTSKPGSWRRCFAKTSRNSEPSTRRSETPVPKPDSHLTSRRSVRFEILRDPVWNNIRVDELTLKLVDTEVFQRLRYVRQLGWTYLVYPGATHTRFEHALGTHHLARRTLALLCESEEAISIGEKDQAIVRSAALLHDVGHYPFSHALEEIGALHHEDVARPLVTEGGVAELLTKDIGADAPLAVFELIVGRSACPLQGLIAGSLD